MRPVLPTLARARTSVMLRQPASRDPDSPARSETGFRRYVDSLSEWQ